MAAMVFESSLAAAAPFAVGEQFPNIQVLAQDKHEFVLAPDLRDTLPGRWWFYWNFKLSVAPGTR
jgi:hypothetical protein